METKHKVRKETKKNEAAKKGRNPSVWNARRRVALAVILVSDLPVLLHLSAT